LKWGKPTFHSIKGGKGRNVASLVVGLGLSFLLQGTGRGQRKGVPTYLVPFLTTDDHGNRGNVPERPPEATRTRLQK